MARSTCFWLYGGSIAIFGAGYLLPVLRPSLLWLPLPPLVSEALLLLLGLFLTVCAMRRALAPAARSVRALGDALAQAPADQPARLSADGLPAELLPLVRGYNALGEALEAQRRDLHGQLRRTALLTRLSIELRASLDSEAIVQDVLTTILANADVTSADIMLLASSGAIELARSIDGGGVRAIPEASARRLLTSGLAGWALRHGRNAVIADSSTDDRAIWRDGEPAASSALALLLSHNRTTFGVLTVARPARDPFTSQDLLLLEGVAAQLSVALGAARRYLDERRRHEQALQLFEMGQFLTAERSAEDIAAQLIEKSCGVFGARHAALFLADPYTGALKPFAARSADSAVRADADVPISEAASRAWRTHEIAMSRPPSAAPPGEEAEPDCVCVALPLLHSGTAIGALALTHQARGPAIFAADTWSLLTIFTNVAAAALANLQLVAQLRTRAESLRQEVSERTRQLKHSQDLLRTVFDHLPDGLVLMDAREQVLTANDVFCEDVLGQQPQAVIGQPYQALVDQLASGCGLTIEQAPGPGVPGRARCVDTSGQQRWYEIDRYAVASNGAGPNQVIERWRDVSRQEAVHRQLLLHEQLTSMARLAASVVHEVGNPLQSVRSCLDLCHEDPALSPGTAEYVELARSELKRMARILARLRDLYRPPQPSWEWMDLNKLILTMRHIIAPQFAQRRVAIELDLAPDLPAIKAQPDALRQVLLNLALNAQEAMPEGGRLRISTFLDADQCCLTVGDTGVGIDAEQLGRIFEPFHSGRAHGLGLGLYLSKQIIRQHQGDIEITSVVGVGTTVRVALPLREMKDE